MLLILIGILAGMIGGMGIGGGTILIPALIFLMHIPQKTAQSVNLTTFLPVSFVALIVHIRNGRVKYGSALFLTIFAIIGAIIGSKCAAGLPVTLLRKLFGVFLLGMGVYEFFRDGR